MKASFKGVMTFRNTGKLQHMERQSTTPTTVHKTNPKSFCPHSVSPGAGNI